MKKPRWIPANVIIAIHAELIAEHGGEIGILNPGQLSSTLARPSNHFIYRDASNLFELAAVYGYGFAKNHCFVDGNKRIALASIDLFLGLNGYELIAEEVDTVFQMIEIAQSLRTVEEDQVELALWIEKNSALYCL